MAAESSSSFDSMLLVPIGAAAAVAGCAIVGALFGLPVGLLAAAACALSVVIALVWQSLQHLSGEAELTLDEALSLAAPTAAEEQKRAVLRALKDLEYELRVGKISQADFVELSARYREEAKRLILVVDEHMADNRAHAERLLEERLNPPAIPADAQKKSKKRQKKAPAKHAVADEAAPSSEPPTSSAPSNDAEPEGRHEAAAADTPAAPDSEEDRK